MIPVQKCTYFWPMHNSRFSKKKSVKVTTIRLPRFIDLILGIGVNPKMEFSAGYTKKHLLPSKFTNKILKCSHTQ